MRSAVRDPILLIAAILLLSLGAYMLSGTVVFRNASLKMTAGDAAGLRHRLAVDLARKSIGYGLDIEIRPTSGSEAALDAVERGELDIAFVQGLLSLVNDTRNQLTRLILHQRESIEEQSNIQQRSADEIWKQQATKDGDPEIGESRGY